jgi:hypothetical protein
VLEGEAFKLAEEYQAIHDQCAKDQQAIEEDAIKRYRDTYAKASAEMYVVWRRMAAMVGLDPDISWAQPNIALESKYISKGFAAFVEIDIPKDHPLLNQSEPSPEESSKKVSLN